jgi:teichuronic acid biosynthesis glycosyltransferase TuaC
LIKSIPQNGKKVLLVTCTYPHYSSKSSGTFVANWAEQLKAEGLNIRVYKRDHLTFGSYLTSFSRVYEFYRNSRAYEYEWDGIPVYRQGIHLRLPLDYSKSAPRLTYKKMKPEIERIYKQFPFDLVYLATWGDLSLAMSWIAKEMRIPYISSAIGDHTNLYYNKPNSIYYRYEHEIFLGSEFVICVSDDLNKKVKAMTDGKANTFTYYSGVDTQKFHSSKDIRNNFRSRLGYVDDDFIILFVGRLTKPKGVYELLEAFASLSSYNRSIKLLLVGSLMELGNFKKHIQRLGIKSKVKLIGSVGHEEIPGYMNAADAFVLPSWMEGLPNVVMEACACECPVIASAVGGIPELIENNKTGFLVTPKSTAELADRLRFVIINPETVANVARNARQNMLKKFNYHKNGRLLLNQMEKIFNQRKEDYQTNM